MDKKIGYKACALVICCNGREVITSLCATLDARLMYNRNGLPTHRLDGLGPLCVFTSISKAIQALETFLTNECLEDVLIYRCEYVPSNDTSVWYYDEEKIVTSIEELPESTALADEVTIGDLLAEWLYTLQDSRVMEIKVHEKATAKEREEIERYRSSQEGHGL